MTFPTQDQVPAACGAQSPCPLRFLPLTHSSEPFGLQRPVSPSPSRRESSGLSSCGIAHATFSVFIRLLIFNARSVLRARQAWLGLPTFLSHGHACSAGPSSSSLAFCGYVFARPVCLHCVTFPCLCLRSIVWWCSGSPPSQPVPMLPHALRASPLSHSASHPFSHPCVHARSPLRSTLACVPARAPTPSRQHLHLARVFLVLPAFLTLQHPLPRPRAHDKIGLVFLR